MSTYRTIGDSQAAIAIIAGRIHDSAIEAFAVEWNIGQATAKSLLDQHRPEALAVYHKHLRKFCEELTASIKEFGQLPDPAAGTAYKLERKAND